MHIPRGKPVHENLKTSYVNTAALLADLQISGFTGYLQVIFPYGQGYIFIGTGKILNAIDEGGERLRRGEEAIDAILLRASSPDGLISVYNHNRALIEAIAGRIDGETLYQELESEFTDLEKLVAKLSRQQDTRFYLEIKIDKIGDGVIYIIDGNIDAVLSLTQGEILEGDVANKRMLELVANEHASYFVYRCRQIAPAPANVIAFPEIPPSLEPPAMTIVSDESEFEAEFVDEVSAELSADLCVDNDDEPTSPVEVVSTQASNVEVSVEPMIDASFESSATTEIEADTDAEFKEKLDKLLALMSEVVAVIERSVAQVVKNGNFAVALRAGLLKVTEQYPFFDPFAAEFEYQNGKIHFSAAAAPIDLVNGLTKALRFALWDLTRMTPAPSLRQEVADALSKLQHSRRADFEYFGLTPVLAEIVAID